MQNILAIVVLLMLGLALRRLAAYEKRHPAVGRWLFTMPENLAEGLTSFVIYVSLPSLVLLKIPTLRISGEILVPVVLPWVMLGISVALVLAVCRLFHWSGSVKGLLLLLVPLGNTSFVGIPMVETFLGEEYVPYALLYDQFGSFIALATYGSLIIALYGGRTGESGLEWRTVALKIAAFPPFAALVVALAITGISYPAWVTSILQALSSTLVPLVITAVGFKLEFRISAERRLPLAAGLTLKLLVVPLIALAGCAVLGLEGPAVKASVLESGMPSQVAAWAVAMRAGLEAELGAAMVGLGILFSLGTLFFLSLLL